MERVENTRYGRYVGRVGALAVALGVGMAVATGYGVGIAYADETANESGSETGPNESAADPVGADDDTSDENTDGDEGEQSEVETEPEEEPDEDAADDDPDAAEPADDDATDTDTSSEATPPPETSVEPTPTERSGLRTVPLTPQLSTPPPVETVATEPPEVLIQPEPIALSVSVADESATPMLLSSSVSEPVARVVVPQPVLPDTALDLVSTVVSMVLSQVVAPGPVRPPDPTVLWVVVGWVRREIERTFFNDVPNAVPDNVTTPEDTSLIIDVTANDEDDFRDVLTVVSVTQPENGSVVVNPDGTLTYTPNKDFDETDTFTYTVTDEGSPWHLHGLLSLFRGQTHTTTQTVTVTVTPVNDAPIADNDSYTVDEDETLLAGTVLANDSDLDNTAAQLSAKLENGPEHGTLSLQPDGTFTYTPDENYYGSDKFTYRAFDGTDTGNLATVTITVNPVNDAPNAVDDNATVDEGGTTVIDVLDNDSDVDSAIDPTSVEVTQPSHGTVRVNDDGTIEYTSDGTEVTADSFTYTVADAEGARSVVRTVFVTITPVNDSPVADTDSYTVAEDQTLTVLAAQGVLVGDTDPDNTAAQLSAQLVSGPSHGTLTLGSDGGFTYKPASNYFGSDSFTYRVSDGTDVSQPPTTVTITVTPVNDAPDAIGDTATVAEGATTVINVLANDTDPEGNSTIDPTSVAATQPAHGTVTVNNDGTVTYTSNGDEVTEDSFTYTVADTDGKVSDPVTVTVTITPVNDPPVEGDGSTVCAPNQLTGVVTGTVDVDDPDSTLTYTLKQPISTSVGTVTVDKDTGAWIFTPTGQARLDAFSTPGEQTVTFEILATDGQYTEPVTVIATIDPVEGAVTEVINVDYYATDVVANGNLIYISGSDRIHVYNTVTNKFVDTKPGTPEIDGIDTTGDLLLVRNGTLYVLNGRSNDVDVVNLSNNNIVADSIEVPGSAFGMYGMAVDDNFIYVSDWLRDNIYVVSLTTYTFVGGVSVKDGDEPASPMQMIVGPRGLYVANREADEVLVVTGGNSVRIPVGDYPEVLYLNGDYLYAANQNDGSVSVIDTRTNTVSSTIEGTGAAVEMVTVGNRLYVVNGGSGAITVVDTTSNTVVDVIAVGGTPRGVAAVGNKLYVTRSDGTMAVVTLLNQSSV